MGPLSELLLMNLALNKMPGRCISSQCKDLVEAFPSSFDHLKLGVSCNWCAADLHMRAEGRTCPSCFLLLCPAFLQQCLPHSFQGKKDLFRVV